MGRYPLFLNGQNQYGKMAILLKILHILNGVPVRIPVALLTELEKQS